VGMFKQFKDLKATVHEAPAMVANAQQLAANAQAMAANQAAMQQAAAAPPVAAVGPDFEPIAGVSLALYADISKSLATVNYDMARAPEVAASKGVDAASWAAALDGWNARITANPVVAKQFNSLYTGR
jgi:hypothetical protein